MVQPCSTCCVGSDQFQVAGQALGSGGGDGAVEGADVLRRAIAKGHHRAVRTCVWGLVPRYRFAHHDPVLQVVLNRRVRAATTVGYVEGHGHEPGERAAYGLACRAADRTRPSKHKEPRFRRMTATPASSWAYE